MRTKMVVDTETATIPWVDTLINGDNNLKRIIALERPIVYDVGWVVSAKNGRILKSHSYLVKEIWFDYTTFNTGYYADKRDNYMKKLANEEIEIKSWNEIYDLLKNDIDTYGAEFISGFNGRFDFWKAIPFTEKFITQWVYGSKQQKGAFKRNQNWYIRNRVLKDTRTKEEKALDKENKPVKDDTPTFRWREISIPIVDIWGIACEYLINIPKYKKWCLENGKISGSGLYFSTNAEVCFQYLTGNETFVEEHTAYADAYIENTILTKAFKKVNITPQLKTFPFRELGTTIDFVDKSCPQKTNVVVDFIIKALNTKNENWKDEKMSPFHERLKKWVLSKEEKKEEN